MAWYDVRFSFNGFMKIEAESAEDAELKVEEILKAQVPAVEDAVKSGVSVEIYDVLAEDYWRE